MNTKALRQKILDLAIHGKLVPQDPNDEPASVLLERIRDEKERLIKEGKIKRPKKSKATSDKPHYPYELPKGWAWCKLEDFINDATDFVASGSFASLRENVKYYDEPGYAILVRTKDFQNGFTKGLVYTDRHGYEFLANSNLFGGELILPNIGASIGKVFIVPHLDIRMTLAPNSIMIKCFKDIHKKWLQYLFLSPFGQEQLRIISSSTAQGKFNKTDLRALQIPIPPFDEQERIISEVEFLSHFIEIIEYGQDKLQETIKQAKSKILDLAIHGKLVPQDPTDEPASELLKRINPKVEITCDNGHYQKLPEGWILTRGKNIFNQMKSCQPFGEEFKYIDIDAIDNKQQKINKIKTIKVANAPSRASRYTQKGDVVFSMVRPYLKNIAIVPENDCIASTGFYVCSPKELLLTGFCYYLMVSDYVVNGLNQYMKGDNSPSINKKNVDDWFFPVPPLKEQHRIVAKIEEIFAQLDAIEASL